jgi:hypothetical protein
VNSTKALVEFIPHAHAASVACSIEVSTTEDMDSPIADLNGSYSPMASDNHDSYPRETGLRHILVGKNVALSPLTKYYYRLHCGGAIREGSFTTASLSSGRHIPEEVPALGNTSIIYGAAYSRSVTS